MEVLTKRKETYTKFTPSKTGLKGDPTQEEKDALDSLITTYTPEESTEIRESIWVKDAAKNTLVILFINGEGADKEFIQEL